MSRPFKDADLTAVDVALQNLQVAPEVDRYAALRTAPAVDRYTALKANRYAALYATDRYAALRAPVEAPAPAEPVVDRYRRIRYSGLKRLPRPPTRIDLNFYTPPPPRGWVAYFSTVEYEDCYENGFSEGLYPIGALIDFSEAAEARYCNTGEDGYTSDDWYLFATPVDGEVETHHPCECQACDITYLDDVLEVAQKLRAKLLEDPGEFVGGLGYGDLYDIREWAGLRHTPSQEEVLAAIMTDVRHGLGAAALDQQVWNGYEEQGALGAELEKVIEEAQKDGYVHPYPTEAFIFDPDNLHRDTPETLPLWGAPERRYYRIYGQYCVARVEYTSDPNREVIAGWRSLFMVPHGEGRMPDFEQYK